MADRTSIEWTEASWNPIRAGTNGWHCEIVSPGCENCYAQAINKRLGTGLPYLRTQREDALVRLDERILTQPLRWRRPRRIFVCSMTDLFGEWVPDEWVDRVFAVMALSPQHTFQVLTKRAERMRFWAAHQSTPERIAKILATTGHSCPGWPLPNVWLGGSIEDQRRTDERLHHILATPAAVRWISYEPALGPIKLSFESWGGKRLGWVVVGGESGPSARPFDVNWARAVIQQCRAAQTPVFMKQLGTVSYEWTKRVAGIRHRKGGAIEEWPSDLRIREYPAQP